MPREWSRISKSFSKNALSPDSITYNQFDSLLTIIETLQLNAQSGEKRPFEQLYKAAFDTISGCFQTVGKGLANLSYPEAAQAPSRKHAAKLNGEYWAARLKRWMDSDQKSVDTSFSAQILYSTILYEKEVGDTLFVLVLVPIGSIVFQK